MLLVPTFVAFAALAVAGPAFASIFDAGTVQNKFSVKFSLTGFYSMPRTVAAAEGDHYAQAASRTEDNTTVWCRKGDYRVCVLYDKQGSVAGMQMSVRVSDVKESGVPYDVVSIPEWYRQTLLGEDVYTATTFFVPKSTLRAGGRALDDDTLTVEGLSFLQTDRDGKETARLPVGIPEADATSAGFTEQNCFPGMGKHYFQELRKTGTCAAYRPFFLLYSTKTKQLHGLGFSIFGKATKDGRNWFESPPTSVIKRIAPNRPECLTEWGEEYGSITLHVYFVERPYFIRC